MDALGPMVEGYTMSVDNGRRLGASLQDMPLFI